MTDLPTAITTCAIVERLALVEPSPGYGLWAQSITPGLGSDAAFLQSWERRVGVEAPTTTHGQPPPLPSTSTHHPDLTSPHPPCTQTLGT